MIKINNYTNQQNVRSIGEMIEPLIVKQIQKQNHTFLVYKCNDYSSFKELIKIHRFNCSKKPTYYQLIEKYWSAIDIIHIKIKNMPTFERNKKYFDKLRNLQLQEKEIEDIECFEVKLIGYSQKTVLSVKTYELIKALKKINKELRFIHVNYKGNIHFQIEKVEFKPENYKIRTHYGRENRYENAKQKK